MSLFLLRITSSGVFIGSFIVFLLRTGSWGVLPNWIILRIIFFFFAALMCVGAWMIIVEVVPVLPRKLRSAWGYRCYRCREFWFSFKNGIFTKNPEDLAENVRDHMRNFRCFMWISAFCFLGTLASYAALSFTEGHWHRVADNLVTLFSAAFLPAIAIFLQSKGCLLNISAMSGYMVQQEVRMTIISTFCESGRVARWRWKKIFPNLLLRY